jgi:hypothetical protein
MILKLEVHADVMAEPFYKQHLITGLLCRSVILKQKPLTHTTSVLSYSGHWENIFSVKTLDLAVTFTYFFLLVKEGCPERPCGLLLHCIRTNSSATCQCENGFSGNGSECTGKLCFIFNQL